MAGFGFTEAQEMFRREVRSFAQTELAPRSKEIAKLEVVPLDVVRQLGKVGLLGIPMPEEYGGQGSDWVSWGIAVEELGRVCAFASIWCMVTGAISIWFLQSSEEIKWQWLPPLLRGEKVFAWGLTEPDAGSDAAAIKTTAVREGDYYILNGEKTSLTVGTAGDIAMICAKTDPVKGAKGVTDFWVPLDLPGVSRSHAGHTGWKPMASGSLFLDNVRVPVNYRLGEEGAGFAIGMALTNYGRVGLALCVLGLAEASLEETIDYVLQRTAFGQPIARFEGVSFKIAEHATLLEAARLLCYRSLYHSDQGVRHIKESAMCKWWCPHVAFNAIHDCILLHGHIGYSEEYPLEQRLRDALGFEFTDGTAEIMKIIIARELMGNTAIPY